MKGNKLEPGLLQVFRWYVIVQACYLLLSLLLDPFIEAPRDPRRDVASLNNFVWLSSAELFLLFLYLAWPWLKEKLGRFYIPLGLALATTGLILDQHFISGFNRVWQPFPFLYILLIITAWQYSYTAVLTFGLGATALELLAIWMFPFYRPFGPPEFVPDVFAIYGRLVASLASYLILGYVVNHLVAAQREQRQRLSEANLKLVQHASTIEQLTLSRERNRISRELHDTLAHTLSALAVQFDALATVWGSIPDKARGMIEQMQATTRSGLDETRRALRDLRASPLEEIGLVLALQGLAEDFAARHNLSLQLDMPKSLDDLPPEIEQCYYRIAQESLENIARHAAAEKLTIKMVKGSSSLTMIVSDDGSGFDISDDVKKEHLGIQGMQERAGLIGADLKVDSSPGGGTTVRLHLENGA